MADSLGNGAILCDIDRRGVATVTFNRPAVNNAYNGDFIDGLLQALDLLGAQQGLRCVLLRGNGRHFQAGADLTWIRACSGGACAASDSASRRTAEAVRRLDAAEVPTIALVHGGCFGGGTGIVAAC